MLIIGNAIENSVDEASNATNSALVMHPGSIDLLHLSTDILNRAYVSEVFFPITFSCCPRGGQSIWLIFSLQQSARISLLKAKWSAVQGANEIEVMLILWKIGLQYSWQREILKTLYEALVRSKPGMPTMNINPPSGLVVTVSQLGQASFCTNCSEVMISLFAVLMPMLANKMMKMVMTTTEVSPPVDVVQSLSPEQRTKLEVGNRSRDRRALAKEAFNEGIIPATFEIMKLILSKIQSSFLSVNPIKYNLLLQPAPLILPFFLISKCQRFDKHDVTAVMTAKDETDNIPLLSPACTDCYEPYSQLFLYWC